MNRLETYFLMSVRWLFRYGARGQRDQFAQRFTQIKKHHYQFCCPNLKGQSSHIPFLFLILLTSNRGATKEFDLFCNYTPLEGEKKKRGGEYK